MFYHKFSKPDGTTLAWVNIDTVIAAHPTKDGKVALHTPSLNMEVDASQFEDALKRCEQSRRDDNAVLIRLTQSVDRLTVRIPSSIRLHM